MGFGVGDVVSGVRFTLPQLGFIGRTLLLRPLYFRLIHLKSINSQPRLRDLDGNLSFLHCFLYLFPLILQCFWQDIGSSHLLLRQELFLLLR